VKNKALSSQPFGYKKKPLRVYAVAFYLLLAPWINFILSLKFQKQDPGWYNPAVWLEYFEMMRPRLLILLALTLSSGVLVLLVRKASWAVAIITLALVIIYNMTFLGGIPWQAVLLLAFVVFTPFRKPYLNPSLRWWEQAPRFDVDLFASIPESQSRIHVYDISEGGLLGEFLGSAKPDMDSIFYVEFEGGPKILGKVVRRQQDKYIGLHFEKVSKVQFKQLKKFIKSLRRKGAAVSKR